MLIFPADRECFVYLDVLAGLDASAAKNALLRIATIKWVRVVLFIRFRTIGNGLMLEGQQFFRIVDRAVSVVVVAHGAIKYVIAKNPIECFPLRGAGLFRFC